MTTETHCPRQFADLTEAQITEARARLIARWPSDPAPTDMQILQEVLSAGPPAGPRLTCRTCGKPTGIDGRQGSDPVCLGHHSTAYLEFGTGGPAETTPEALERFRAAARRLRGPGSGME